jgi:acetoin utilization protein AcuB
MLVETVITRSVVTTDPRRSVESVARLMREGRFRHMPVLEFDRLVGILSDRDVERHGDTRTVGEAMRREPIVVTAETPIEVAAGLMLDNKIGALPVVEEGSDTLVGIVTQSDLFAILGRLLGGDGPSTRLELRLRDLAGELAQVTRLAYERHVPITGLVTLPAVPAVYSRTVVLRVGTIAARPFVAALRECGIDVDLPTAQRGGPDNV